MGHRGLFAILGRRAGAAMLLALSACATAHADDAPLLATTELEAGEASYFADEMAGNRTASGEICDPDTLTAAHRTLPLGSLLRVTNAETGDSVIVRVNDRGPFRKGRVIDLSRAAANEIGIVARGHAPVRLSLLADPAPDLGH